MNEEHFTFHLQNKYSGTFANLKYEELLYPKNPQMCDPIPAAHPHKEVPPPRHLPIVLVKVAYYASGSARFLPKLCSNYARFSKLCYFFKKLFCAQTSQLTRQV